MLKKILYLGWISKGNVGDDLLYTTFKQMILEQNYENRIFIDIDVYYPINDYKMNLNNYDLVVLGGGSLLTLDFWEDICLEAISNNISVVVWGTGIDARERKLISQIIHSYKTEQPIKYISDKTKYLVDNAILCGVRGNIDNFLLNNNNSSVIGDPGIIFNKLIKNLPEIKETHEFICNDENVILINWGTSYNNIVGSDEESLEEQLIIASQILLNRGYKVIVYPIWTEDIEPCRRFVERFKNNNIINIDKVYDASGIISLIRKSRFSINLKLHANILSFSANKPFISLGYGLKNYDFCESVDLVDLNIFTDEVNTKSILQKIEYIEDNYINIQNRMQVYLEYYSNMQKTFIKQILKILSVNERVD